MNLKQYPYGIQKFNSKHSSEQKIDKNVTRKRVSNQTTINCYGYFLYLSPPWKKVNGFSMSMKRILLESQQGILKGNQLKDKYVTTKMEKV